MLNVMSINFASLHHFRNIGYLLECICVNENSAHCVQTKTSNVVEGIVQKKTNHTKRTVLIEYGLVIFCYELCKERWHSHTSYELLVLK